MTRDVLAVRIEDPRREFLTLFDTSNKPFYSCQITNAPETTGGFLNKIQFQACRETIIQSCGLETRPIPTLSEWGLIALAGAIGLAGLFGINRNRALTKT